MAAGAEAGQRPASAEYRMTTTTAAEIFNRLEKPAPSDNNTGEWDQVSIPALLEYCGFVAPTDEGPEDQSERQIRALNRVGDLSGRLNPSRREVLQRSARLYMTEAWGWTTYEAGHAVKECCILFPPRVRSAEKAFSPKILADILADPTLEEHPEWFIEGYVGREIVTLLSGHPKCGKTTLVSHIVRAVAAGDLFLGQTTVQANVLWLNLEQTEGRVAAGFRDLGADELPIYPFTGTRHDFTDDQLARFIKDNEIGLLVVDSLSKFWAIEDENDATQVTAELGRLLDLARQTGVAVIVIHHLRKSGGTDNLDVRGSGAINSIVDVSLALRKHKDGSENSRVIEAISRYDETPNWLVIELTGAGYSRLGTVAEMATRRGLEKLYEFLTEEPADLTELAEASGLARPTVTKLLSAEYRDGKVGREGKGRKGSPYRFYRYEMLSQQSKPIGETENRNSDDTVEDHYPESFK